MIFARLGSAAGPSSPSVVVRSVAGAEEGDTLLLVLIFLLRALKRLSTVDLYLSNAERDTVVLVVCSEASSHTCRRADKPSSHTCRRATNSASTSERERAMSSANLDVSVVSTSRRDASTCALI